MDCRPLTEITGEANFEPLAKYLTILPKRQLKVVLKLSADQHDFQLIVLRYFNPVRFAGGRKKKKSHVAPKSKEIKRAFQKSCQLKF